MSRRNAISLVTRRTICKALAFAPLALAPQAGGDADAHYCQEIAANDGPVVIGHNGSRRAPLPTRRGACRVISSRRPLSWGATFDPDVIRRVVYLLMVTRCIAPVAAPASSRDASSVRPAKAPASAGKQPGRKP